MIGVDMGPLHMLYVGCPSSPFTSGLLQEPLWFVILEFRGRHAQGTSMVPGTDVALSFFGEGDVSL